MNPSVGSDTRFKKDFWWLQIIGGAAVSVLLLVLVVVLMLNYKVSENHKALLDRAESIAGQPKQPESSPLKIDPLKIELGSGVQEQLTRFQEMGQKIKSLAEKLDRSNEGSKATPNTEAIETTKAQLQEVNEKLSKIPSQLDALFNAIKDHEKKTDADSNELKSLRADQRTNNKGLMTHIDSRWNSLQKQIEWKNSPMKVTCVLVGAQKLPISDLVAALGKSSSQAQSHWKPIFKDYECKAAYGGDSGIISFEQDPSPNEGLVSNMEKLAFEPSPHRYILVVSSLSDVPKEDKFRNESVIDAVVLLQSARDNETNSENLRLASENLRKWSFLCQNRNGRAVGVTISVNEGKLKGEQMIREAIATLAAPRIIGTSGVQSNTEKK